jgi:hypothetical protein
VKGQGRIGTGTPLRGGGESLRALNNGLLNELPRPSGTPPGSLPSAVVESRKKDFLRQEL